MSYKVTVASIRHWETKVKNEKGKIREGVAGRKREGGAVLGRDTFSQV